MSWERGELLDGPRAFLAGVAALADARAEGEAWIELEAIDDDRLDALLPQLGFHLVLPKRLKRSGATLSVGNLRATWHGPTASAVDVLGAGLQTLDEPPIKVLLGYDGNGATARLDASNEVMTIMGEELTKEQMRAVADAISVEVPSVGAVAISRASALGCGCRAKIAAPGCVRFQDGGLAGELDVPAAGG